ncbi:MAG: hypothetical protein C4346_08615 [Chloroflexota bacterium]
MSVDVLQSIRDRVLPMFDVVAEEYRTRVPPGYPIIVDDPERGEVGLELDPNYALYFVSDGSGTYAELRFPLPRSDARSSASREKFSGLPYISRRPVAPEISDQGLRNLIAELMSRWNYQPMIIHITDT